MPTNQRPFFQNFLAAFRAHSAVHNSTKPSSNTSTPYSTTSTTSTTSTNPNTPTPQNTPPSNPRAIATTSNTKTVGATTTALGLHSPRPIASPLSRSPGSLSDASSPSHPSNNHSSNQGISGTIGGGGTLGGRYISNRNRRGSDSSSEGFRDVLGAEKWYIGGRTAAGEERYFKLGVVRRQRSGGSLSLDRLSL